jgi:hypothetical protein
MCCHVMLGLSDCANVLSHDASPVSMHTYAVTCDTRCLSIYMCCHMKLGLQDCVHVVSHVMVGLSKHVHVLSYEARSV